MDEGRRSWIKVEFNDWVLLEELNIYETCALGGVRRLSIIPYGSNDPEDGWVAIYGNSDECTEPPGHARIFSPTLDFSLLPRAQERITRRLFIEVDWNLVSPEDTFPEFDAIEIAGLAPRPEDFLLAKFSCGGVLGVSSLECSRFRELIAGGVLDRIPTIEICFTADGSRMKFPKFLIPSERRSEIGNTIDVPNLTLEHVSPSLLISFVLFGESGLEEFLTRDTFSPFHLYELYIILDSLGLHRPCLEVCAFLEIFSGCSLETIVSLLSHCIERFEPKWKSIQANKTTNDDGSEKEGEGEEEESFDYESPFTLACLNRAQEFFEYATVRERMAAMRGLEGQSSIPNYVTHQRVDLRLHSTVLEHVGGGKKDELADSLMMLKFKERVQFFTGEDEEERIFDMKIQSLSGESLIDCHELIVMTKLGLWELEEEGEGETNVRTVKIPLDEASTRLLMEYCYYDRIVQTPQFPSILSLYKFAIQKNELTLAAALEQRISAMATELKRLDAFDIAIQNSADQIDGMTELLEKWEKKGLITRAKAEGLVMAGLRNMKLNSRLEMVEEKVDLVLEKLEQVLRVVVREN